VMQSKKRKEDHRQMLRSNWRKFWHDHVLACINRDYLGDAPLLGVEFKLMFWLSRGQIQVLMEDVMASNIKFFKSTGLEVANPVLLLACCFPWRHWHTEFLHTHALITSRCPRSMPGSVAKNSTTQWEEEKEFYFKATY
jgi:hypothetical protein